jgi:ATP-dependent RNA helicase MRH4
VVVFCNRGTKVEELGKYLEEKGVPNVAVSGASAHRHRGSNRHLAGFLKPFGGVDSAPAAAQEAAAKADEPHVLITTSLLSRGLDFGPEIRNVFIVDTPRNMVDFLHRAGRSARAGAEGKVVVFGKLSGRGSEEAREVKRKVNAFAR